jgi:hypothetical protein
LDPAAAAVRLHQATAKRDVHAAAAAAASSVRGAATEIAHQGSAVPGSGASSVTLRTSLLLVLAAVVLLGALALALAISTGALHAVKCPLAHNGKTQACDTNLLNIGTVVLSLASAAGGTLLGLFATPDGKPSAAGTVSAAAK